MHQIRKVSALFGLIILFSSLELQSFAQADEKSPRKGTEAISGTERASLFASSVRPLLAKYCTDCHGATKPKAGLNLAVLQDEAGGPANRKVWMKVRESVEGGLMPPDGRPQPAQEQVDSLVKWLESQAGQVDCQKEADPGRVVIRRLNRVEYNNTVRDLVEVDFRPADDFPSDDVGYGFDNIGDVLTLPPLLMEKYLAAAEDIAELTIMAGDSARGPIKSWDAHNLSASAGGQPYGEDARILTSAGEIAVQHSFSRDGMYLLRVRAYGEQAGTEPVRMAVLIDGKPLESFDVAVTEKAPKTYEIRQRISGGDRRVAVAFLNDYYSPDETDPQKRDRNLVVESIEVEGPLYVKGDPLPESHRKIIFRTPSRPEEWQDCATDVLRKFATRAYRRPVTGGELARLLRFVDLARENGDGFERGIQLAVQAVLVSPQFLFRVELNRGRRRGGKAARRPGSVALNDFEIASRLSYFLWSTMPDDELTRLAGDNTLHTPEALTRQVSRMLSDPKAQALVDNFAGQWLQLRNLSTVRPDSTMFPAFDEPLREAMQKESELFFASVMRDDCSILDFLDCDYTFLNDRLARHYGISGVSGEKFRRVQLTGKERGGLITQASILTVTSNPTRTSPVKRGKWVLEQILGTPPPPAPPNVPQLESEQGEKLAGTLRQRMEQHRANPSCASCHNRLDPPGFGLEKYDAIGAWRDREGDSPVNASGKLPSGESFQGPGELKAILKSRQREFTHCLTEKLLTYSLGRGLDDEDTCAVDKIVDTVAADQYRFRRLVLEIVRSEPFLKRRG
jgi:hypothetical protein